MHYISYFTMCSFGAKYFGCSRQSEESKLEGVSGLMQALPEYIQAAAAAAASATSRGGAKKDASFTMPVSFYC